MEKIADFIGLPLLWRRPALLKAVYELTSGDTLIATVSFRSLWGTFATARSADGCWTFKRAGFMQTRVTIRACDSDVDLATFRNNTWSGGGTLVLPDGRRYPANTNFWQTQYEFTTDAGTALIRYHGPRLFSSSGDVTLLPDARDVPELPWMVMLGWYLVVMMESDSESAAVVV